MNIREVIAQARAEAVRIKLEPTECLEVHIMEDGTIGQMTRRATVYFAEEYAEAIGYEVEPFVSPCLGIVHSDGVMILKLFDDEASWTAVLDKMTEDNEREYGEQDDFSESVDTTTNYKTRLDKLKALRPEPPAISDEDLPLLKMLQTSAPWASEAQLAFLLKECGELSYKARHVAQQPWLKQVQSRMKTYAEYDKWSRERSAEDQLASMYAWKEMVVKSIAYAIAEAAKAHLDADTE